MRFVTTYQYYAKSPQQLQKWTQPNSYQSLFPRQIKSIKTSDLVNNNQNADFKVSVGLGVITIPFDFKLNFKYPSNTANEFYANGGDLKFLVVSKCDVLTTYLSCLDCILIKIDARQLHDFLSSSKSLKFSV